ncbi:hypothetical protein [Rhodospirillum sp. A1_3_36]|uniref:hypothetical protein n=1 Tax=Rhodospirillum sp. A1_3_36 TaxID=3391666 RepID=UPI0039A4D473
MELNTRRDHFSYFLGFVARTQDRLLRDVEKWFSERGYSEIFSEEIFEYCPFNDNQKHIIRSYQIFESGKRSDLISRIIELVGEYLFLASDFEPTCCGDGRTFYEKTLNQEIVLVCDRCEVAYSLNEHPIQIGSRKKMTKVEFTELFDGCTAEDWPYHVRVRELLGSLPVNSPHQ